MTDPSLSFTIFQRHPQRAQALASGDLIDVTAIAREDTFAWPTAITRRACDAAIALQRVESEPVIVQDNADRIRQLLRIAHDEILKRSALDRTRLEFTVPVEKRATTLILVSTTDNDGNPALTIGVPEEFRLPDPGTEHP